MPALKEQEYSDEEKDRSVVESGLDSPVMSVWINAKEDGDLTRNEHDVGKHFVNHFDHEQLVLVAFTS